ncbi:hypothetical protein EBU24_04995 [bacterium]|nr:hypothetical protein [bacterium]
MNIYDNYKKLPELGFGVIDFFSISITDYDIRCLAWFSNEIFNKYKEFGFDFTLNNKHGYLESTKDNVSIILTFK